jgi:hypothetical protein
MERVIFYGQFNQDKAEPLKEAAKIEIHESLLQAMILLAYKGYLEGQLKVFESRMADVLENKIPPALDFVEKLIVEDLYKWEPEKSQQLTWRLYSILKTATKENTAEILNQLSEVLVSTALIGNSHKDFNRLVLFNQGLKGADNEPCQDPIVAHQQANEDKAVGNLTTKVKKVIAHGLSKGLGQMMKGLGQKKDQE